MFVELEHPSAVKITGTPLKLSERGGRVFAPAPGEHNEEIFVGLLGHSRDLDRWQEQGVIWAELLGVSHQQPVTYQVFLHYTAWGRRTDLEDSKPAFHLMVRGAGPAPLLSLADGQDAVIYRVACRHLNNDIPNVRPRWFVVPAPGFLYHH
jgi:hypothetical protein